MSSLQRFIDGWVLRYSYRHPLPMSYEMGSNGNFLYIMNGQNVGFAFGAAGRATSCYWLKELEEYISIPDASNQYVSEEKLEALITGGFVGREQQVESDEH